MQGTIVVGRGWPRHMAMARVENALAPVKRDGGWRFRGNGRRCPGRRWRSVRILRLPEILVLARWLH